MNELEIKNIELPKLEIKDYEMLKELAEKDVEKYQNYLVTEETLDSDIKKRAELRKIAKSINDKRLEIEKTISEPIKNFKKDCAYLKQLYENAANMIDAQVKIFEEKKKEEKRETCIEIYNQEIQEFKDNISFEKIFNSKWLNKGTSITEIAKEIKEVVENARKDLETIKTLKSEFELELTNTYFESLDISKAVLKNAQLHEQAQKMKETMERQNKIKEQQAEKMLTEEVSEEKIDPIKTYTLKITARLSKQIALKKFLELNKMDFEKVD